MPELRVCPLDVPTEEPSYTSSNNSSIEPQFTDERDNGIGTAPSVTGSICEGDSNGTDVSGNDR